VPAMQRADRIFAICGALLVLAGCGADAEPKDPSGPGTGGAASRECGADSFSVAGTTGEFPGEEAASSQCGALITREPVAATAIHVPACSTLSFSSNPPSSGDHYGTWADFQEFSAPVPRGYWVHSLEHRAVVVVYNCADCADEVEAARAWIETLPEDPVCVPYNRARRVILTPDPLLDVRWGAAAWGFTLRSDCFEPEVFTDFVSAHGAGGPENICSPP
jgi:hypothetical protein